MKINDIIISINITDLPGKEKYRQIALNYCTKKDMIVFIYEIGGVHGSFKTVKELIKQVKENYNNTHFALIGAKADLEYERQVSFEEGEELAKKKVWIFLWKFLHILDIILIICFLK